MYIIKIGEDKFKPEIQAIIETMNECFNIYWNYYNSVQSINKEHYVQVTCLATFTHYDITKGISLLNSCNSDFIKFTKNHSYMIDRVNSIKGEETNI